jgi:hypothetical protein
VLEPAQPRRATAEPRHHEYLHAEPHRGVCSRREDAITAADHEARVAARHQLARSVREQHEIGAVAPACGVHVARHRQVEDELPDQARVRRHDHVITRPPTGDGELARERVVRDACARERIAREVLEVDQMQAAVERNGGSAHRAPCSMAHCFEWEGVEHPRGL